LFDYSGTLFRLEDDEREVDGHVQAELMRRLTQPTGRSVEMTPEAYHAWINRDLTPHLHREAYLHVLRESGLADHHAEALYDRVIDPSSWTPYPDTAGVLKGLQEQGIKTAVVSNIAFDVRPAFEAIGAHVDEFVLSFEVGAIKPNAAIFETALTRLGVAADDAVMIGDSDEADGGARAIGCGFVLVDPLPTAQRRDGLRSALTEYGVAV
jgi:HAD superfamily hydrolase (TIGR01509 family)